jgi:hypothetical protein
MKTVTLAKWLEQSNTSQTLNKYWYIETDREIYRFFYALEDRKALIKGTKGLLNR